MSKSIISEGKTTNEAIENGLKILNVSKNMVDIKVLENEEKRSFFSILTPRVVKVELTLKENIKDDEKKFSNRHNVQLSEEEQKQAKHNLEIFLNELLPKLKENVEYDIKCNNELIEVSINSGNLGFLIGYRGETLYAFQNILSAIAGRNINNRIRIILDIEGYKEKREKTLKELAQKVAKTVEKTKKSITLEPMKPHERRIIHSELQNSNKVETKSIGEEPRRRIVVSLKK